MSVKAQLVVTSNRLPSMAMSFDQKVDDAINRAVLNAAQIADPITPIDKGFLRANKTLTFAGGGRHEGSIDWNQDYAVYQNEGTIFVPAKHFADKGLEGATPSFLSDLQNLGLR